MVRIRPGSNHGSENANKTKIIPQFISCDQIIFFFFCVPWTAYLSLLTLVFAERSSPSGSNTAHFLEISKTTLDQGYGVFAARWELRMPLQKGQHRAHDAAEKLRLVKGSSLATSKETPGVSGPAYIKQRFSNGLQTVFHPQSNQPCLLPVCKTYWIHPAGRPKARRDLPCSAQNGHTLP